MKVLLLVVGLNVGGTETHVLDLASLMDARFNVVVCSLKPIARLGHELQARGVRVISLEGKGKGDIRVLWRFWKVLKVERPDVVHAFLFWANVTARLISQFRPKVHVISSYHDEIVSEGWINRVLDRFTMRWTEHLVCCSEAVRRSMKQHIGGAGKPVTVIPFGVHAERFRGAEVEKGRDHAQAHLPVLGTICRLVEPKKGLTVLLDAIAKLEQDQGGPVCQVMIVGEGPADSELRLQSERLGLAMRVRFMGARRDIPELLSQIDIFVLPSVYEGFGIAILEAMAAGKPVIATWVGGVPEFVKSGESGLLVPPGDSNKLAAAIHLLLSDSARARVMGLNGQAHVLTQYTIQSVVKQHEQLYDRCMARLPGVSVSFPVSV